MILKVRNFQVKNNNNNNNECKKIMIIMSVYFKMEKNTICIFQFCKNSFLFDLLKQYLFRCFITIRILNLSLERQAMQCPTTYTYSCLVQLIIAWYRSLKRDGVRGVISGGGIRSIY